jgi:hypothetical protein
MDAGFGVHDEVVFAAQVHTGVKLYWSRWDVSQPQVLGDGHKMNLHFDPGKGCPDAVSRTSRKRQVCQSVAML